MHMSRDWWAVLLAALAVVLVKLGVVSGVALGGLIGVLLAHH